jgi:hypothetical protein
MADETTGRRRRLWGAAVPRLSLFAAEHLLLLPLGAAIALVWANTGPESYFRFSYAAAFVVNDVAMVFFFGLMTKEVVQATAPGGVLHPWRRALLPVIAFHRRHARAHADSHVPGRSPRRADARLGLAGHVRHGSGAGLLHRAADLRQAPPGDPVRDSAGYHV